MMMGTPALWTVARLTQAVVIAPAKEAVMMETRVRNRMSVMAWGNVLASPLFAMMGTRVRLTSALQFPGVFTRAWTVVVPTGTAVL